MPIMDKVLVNQKDIDESDRVSMLPRMQISDYIEQNVRKNIAEYSDSICLVSMPILKILKTRICN